MPSPFHYTADDLADIARHFVTNAQEAARKAGLTTGATKRAYQEQARTWAAAAAILDDTTLTPKE